MRYLIDRIDEGTAESEILSNFIGKGTAGKVYKGIMSDNRRVAVERIIGDNNLETAIREVASSSHVRHPNLVA